MLNLKTSKNDKSSKEEDNDKKKDNQNMTKIESINRIKPIKEKSNSSTLNSNKKLDKNDKLNSPKKDKKITNKTLSHKSSINSKQIDIFSNIVKSKKYENDTKELKKRIKILEEKSTNLEIKNIYYYNTSKKNLDWNYEKEYNNRELIKEYIELKRNKNLNGYNQLMIDINDKINDFIEDENIRDREKLAYYKKLNELNDDIIYRIYIMKLLQEKERKKDIERRDLNKNYYIINYNKKSGEIDPNTNNYINKYESERYGSPYNKKAFNNDRYMMPARYSKNGIGMNNQYISIDNPEDYYKYQIYDRFKNDYKKYKNNVLKRSGSNTINSKKDFLEHKYNIGKK